ncbi:MAG: hypothetical protein MJZ02_00175 [Paludibacteraceae bacterium]|nr:hypothetical protein [Paludibacteraceae bacterium]
MKRLFLLLYCIFLPAAVFSVEKVLIYKISASAVSQSCTIAEGRCVVGSFYRPYVSAMDSADIVVNIEIDRKGKVVLQN